MRLLTAVSLVRVQQGEPNRSATRTGGAPVWLYPMGLDSKPRRENDAVHRFPGPGSERSGCLRRPGGQAGRGLSGESNRGSHKRKGTHEGAFPFVSPAGCPGQRDCASAGSRLFTGRSRAPAVRGGAPLFRPRAPAGCFLPPAARRGGGRTAGGAGGRLTGGAGLGMMQE